MVAFLGLTACSANQQAQSVASIEAAYSIDAMVADDYVTGRLGITPDPTITKQMGTYNNTVHTDLVQLRTAAQNGTTITAAEQVAAQTALEAFSSYMVSHGILTAASKAQAAKEIALKNAPKEK